jgi:hypothetical protein
MSRTISSRSPRRRGTFRPQVEALEDRFAPVALPGMPKPPDLAFLAGLQAAQQQRAIPTTNDVILLADGSVVGSSTLIRTEQGVTAHLTASGLEPGAYTFWMKVDTTLPDGTIVTVSGRLAGHVVGQDGILNFAAHVSEGEILGAGNDVNPDFPSGALQDPLHSQITLVVRSHGEADPGHIYEQTHTHEPTVAFNFLRSIHVAPLP